MRRLRIERNIPLLLLLIFILNLEFSNALKGRWKPANEDARRFPTEKSLQNYKIISAGTTIQNTRRIQINGNMQNVRRYPINRALQSVRRFSNDRTQQNVRRYPIDRALQNVRRFPIDRSSPNYRGVPLDKTLQNYRNPIDTKLQNNRFPIDVKLPNDRFPIERNFQNKRFSIDRKLQNDKFPINIKRQNDKFPIDREFQNVRRISTPKTLHNAKRPEIDEKNQNDRRVSVVRTFATDRRIEYNKRLQNPRIDVSEKTINVNRLLEHNRRSQNELKNKIDMLIQNENIRKDKIEPNGRRMQNFRRIQNDRQAQNYLREQSRRILEEHNQKMLNSRRMQYDKRVWAATPHPILRDDRPKGMPFDRPKGMPFDRPKGMPAEFGKLADRPIDKIQDKPSVEWNSTEFSDKLNVPQEEEQSSGWSNFWKGMMLMMENMADIKPPGGHTLITRTCYCIAATYITAIQDFKKFYMWRYFYENNIQFEVGYLVAEIISKYQRMLEIFHMTTDYFYNHQSKQYAASTYVLYLYTNVLEMGTVISHLCNMLTELEDKYRFIPVPQSGFTDYHLIKVFDDTESLNLANEVLAYEKKMAKLRKEKIRERKQMRDKSLHIGMKITTPDRRPKYRSWPLSYGWSIEYNW